MLQRLIRGIINILFPETCASCKNKLDTQAIDKIICKPCLSKIEKNIPPFCLSCGRKLEKKSFAKHICFECIKKKLYFDRAFSPCVYDGIIKKLIHEFKYKQKHHLGEILGKFMIDFIHEYKLPIECMDYIIPIPLHKTKLREREFNQAEILAKRIAYEFNKDMPLEILKRIKNTKTQTDLEPNKRFLNVKESFVVENSKKIENKNLLIVDDVFTTGATSSEAALVLKKAGANIVFVLTLAN